MSSVIADPTDGLRRRRIPLALGSRLGGAKLLRGGLLLLAALLVLSVVGSLASPDHNHQDLSTALQAPGQPGHLLGTDQLGRDLLAWIAAGIRTSLLVSVSVVAISATIGVAVGMAAGYLGGWVDALLMRVVDLQLAIPPVVLFIAASAVLTPSLPMVIVLLSAVAWVPYTRIVRAQVQAERERGFVAAARLAGTARGRILRVHILPAVLPVAVVFASMQAGNVLLWEAALSFLGLGVQPPHASLGFMIAQGKSVLGTAWWVTVMPGLAVVLLALAFNSIGDGLREYFHIEPEDPSV
jgi:peptide/nickel transport system permease protein